MCSYSLLNTKNTLSVLWIRREANYTHGCLGRLQCRTGDLRMMQWIKLRLVAHAHVSSTASPMVEQFPCLHVSTAIILLLLWLINIRKKPGSNIIENCFHNLSAGGKRSIWELSCWDTRYSYDTVLWAESSLGMQDECIDKLRGLSGSFFRTWSCAMIKKVAVGDTTHTADVGCKHP